MNNQINFDKELDDILLRHGAEQGELHYSLKVAIKEAVDKYVIPKIEMTLPQVQEYNKHLDSTSQKHWYSYSDGYITAINKAHLSLWENKK